MQDEVEPGSEPESAPEIQSPNPKSVRRRRIFKYARWTIIERELRREKGPLLAGVDEVGRGPIAGPVVACAVIVPPDRRAIAGVDDSKRLAYEQRVRLAAKIRERAVSYALGAASVREIDTINIYQASVLAMRRELGRLSLEPNHVVIDGRAMRTLPIPHTAVVHGDARCFSIACASILAKVTRDLLMTRLGKRYPHYIWEHNAGYTTREHVSGLTAHGITPHHRKSFCRISDLLLELEHQSEIEDLEETALDDVGIPDEDDLGEEHLDEEQMSDVGDDADPPAEERV